MVWEIGVGDGGGEQEPKAIPQVDGFPKNPGLWIQTVVRLYKKDCSARCEKIASSSGEPFTVIIDNPAEPKGF